MRLWLKYEIYDIEAVLYAIEKRNQMEKTRSAKAQKRHDEQKELNKLENGKFSLGNMFSNTQSK